MSRGLITAAELQGMLDAASEYQDELREYLLSLGFEVEEYQQAPIGQVVPPMSELVDATFQYMMGRGFAEKIMTSNPLLARLSKRNV